MIKSGIWNSISKKCDIIYDLSYESKKLPLSLFPPFNRLCSVFRFMYRVKVGENLFAEASAPSKKAARQLAAEEAVKELMADGRLQLTKVRVRSRE